MEPEFKKPGLEEEKPELTEADIRRDAALKVFAVTGLAILLFFSFGIPILVWLTIMVLSS